MKIKKAEADLDEPLQLTLENVGVILKITSSESIIDVSRDKGVKNQLSRCKSIANKALMDQIFVPLNV